MPKLLKPNQAMSVIQALTIIRRKFAESGNRARIPLRKRGSFNAVASEQGVRVSNLGNQPTLPWAVFQEAVCLLIRNGGRAKTGNAMSYKLGQPGLPLDSIEGHIAYVVYGKREGETVFRRIAPVAAILIWAGICTPSRSALILRNNVTE